MAVLASHRIVRTQPVGSDDYLTIAFTWDVVCQAQSGGTTCQVFLSSLAQNKQTNKLEKTTIFVVVAAQHRRQDVYFIINMDRLDGDILSRAPSKAHALYC